ncbi:MAG: ABC transporter ATP-binding protein [Saprospiraceae bacterium]|nr:ABC transporter ATP-binding protein [Saprospiraceae bacterium]
MIVAEDVHKYYGNLHVLKGVNASIEKGEIVAIVGKSGAGKTTLLHIIGTLDVANRGRILYDQTDLTKLSDRQLSAFRNKHIGFIFQFHHLLDEFTALENVCIPAYIGTSKKKEVESRAKELLSYLGLADRLTHKPNELSGGEQQRVAIARSLINHPSVVLADEPTGNLDSATSDDIHHLLFKLRDDFQQTFVIVTHNSELADRCDRTLHMEDGQISNGSL